LYGASVTEIGLRLDQIIPAIPHRLLEITIVWNPVRPALGQHFDPALIDPVEDAKLICPAWMVAGVQATELEVREEGCETVFALASPAQGTLRIPALFTLVFWGQTPQASHRRSGH